MSSVRQGLVPYLVLISTVLISTVLIACDLTSNAPKDGGIIDLGPSDQQVVDASVGSEASAVELGIDAASGGDGGSDSGGSTTCASACHGSATSTAPPVSTKGLSATSERGVGAHQAHLKTSSWHVAVSCDDCHLVPKAVADKGHIDTPLPAELIFSAAAKADGAKPAFNGTTCSGTYCHGATLSGGTATSPTWTKVDGSQSACGSCHSLPPKGNHTTSTSCSGCHDKVVDANKKIINASLHIDGKVSAVGGHPAGYASKTVHGPDFLKNPAACKTCHGSTLTGGAGKSCETCHPGWKTKCTFCHGGTLNSTGAPPLTVDGKTAVTVPGVGRHTSHVTAGLTHAAYGCALCHKVPVDALSTGHIDPSPAEVTFTGVATGASYSFSSTTCSAVYCHGSGKSGAGGSALWIGSLSGGCSACHDDGSSSNTTLSGEHKKHIIDKKINCTVCHSCVVNGSKTITDTSKHINGTRDVCGSNLNWNAAAKSCNPACHGSETW